MGEARGKRRKGEQRTGGSVERERKAEGGRRMLGGRCRSVDIVDRKRFEASVVAAVRR